MWKATSPASRGTRNASPAIVFLLQMRHGVSSEYYAIQWFLTLYASDLPQPIVRRIWDRFLVAGWRVMTQIGLVLLYRIQDVLIEMEPSSAGTAVTRSFCIFLYHFVSLVAMEDSSYTTVIPERSQK